MRKNYFKHILMCLCLFTGINVYAETVKIDGIYYNLTSKLKTAEVTNCLGGERSWLGYDEYYSGSVVIPASVAYNGVEYTVTSISNYAFYNGYLTSVTIPNSVTSIGEGAFSACYNLTSITIPNSVTSIGNSAFNNCSYMTAATIGNSVTSIGESAFEGCRGLTSVTIPNSVTSIGKRAFQDCSGLTSVTIPNSLTSINGNLFCGCSSLASIVIPNNVTSVGGNAFWHCRSLTSVTIPNSVTSIGESAFQDCSGLTSVTIPNSLTSINGNLFCGCSSLTSVTIPNSVTSIGRGAFMDCSSLTSVTIPNSVTIIGYKVFSGCSSLTSITIPNNVTIIGSSAFSGCSRLATINIGSGVTTLYEYAFADCPELKDVYCYAENVPQFDDYYGYYSITTLFEGSLIEYATLHVPATSIEQYKATEPWSQFGTIVSTDGTVPEPPTPEKCATPTISYANGELTFNCETEGVDFISEIEDTDIKKYYSKSVSLTATYTITVYATKTGYEDSEVATATLCWIELQPATEGLSDEDAVAEVKALPVLIQTRGGTITVQGANVGTEIAVYSVNGMLQGSAIADEGITILNTSLQPGSVVIVKIGDKSVKVLMK